MAPGGGDLAILIVGACVAAMVVLAAGAAVTARKGNALQRRLDAVKNRGRAVSGGAARAAAIRRNAPTGAVAGVERAVGRWLPRRSALEERLVRTGRPLTVGHYVVAVMLTGLAAFALLRAALGFAPVLSLLVALAAALLLPHAWVGMMAAKRIKAFTALFPEAIDLIVRGLKSGLPVAESVGTVGREMADPVGAEFRRIDHSVRLGRTLEEALWEAARRLATPEFKFFIISLSVQRETGGNLAETLENLSDILRKRRQMRLKVRALSSEARASAYIIGALPFAMFAILMIVSGDYVLQLFTDPRGLLMVGAGLFSMALGAVVMARMVRFEI